MKAPREIRVSSDRRSISLVFTNGDARLDAEYLRVFSPSAEVRGHGPADKVLQTGKRQVEIANVEPVGNYAIRITFSDGHDTGIYSWSYLNELAIEREVRWQEYLDELERAGASRD
ncbi:gamma-butyrobetaine hydroxylase-like domain-containing protein [Nitratireductor basaltis]|uniref:Gamma-butyrobetaine hydroxylase-like N-terminal domain-containing protein n=1 Tax=Nitratireductor basaltis TaxID=472175 RepID=A0A084UAX3_9HYPH|nr:DUF971 domain-containing protein [Nitratireductor basaltis]KFB10109.1 hypothetical protein EL18_01139 [Nitratireductor basaltis]